VGELRDAWASFGAGGRRGSAVANLLGRARRAKLLGAGIPQRYRMAGSVRSWVRYTEMASG
jgi:hypothetical protein